MKSLSDLNLMVDVEISHRSLIFGLGWGRLSGVDGARTCSPLVTAMVHSAGAVVGILVG